MEITSEINRLKAALIKKASKKGLYENFGQREVRKLEDKHSDSRYKNDGVFTKIREFDEWASTYTG